MTKEFDNKSSSINATKVCFKTLSHDFSKRVMIFAQMSRRHHSLSQSPLFQRFVKSSTRSARKSSKKTLSTQLKALSPKSFPVFICGFIKSAVCFSLVRCRQCKFFRISAQSFIIVFVFIAKANTNFLPET